MKFRLHSQSKCLLDIQIASWILELPFLEHSSSKKRKTYEFDLGTLFEHPLRIDSAICRKVHHQV